jgi:hypothetical protein
MILICMETLLVALAVQAVNTLILVRSRRELLISNLALRQQLTVYKRKQRRPSATESMGSGTRTRLYRKVTARPSGATRSTTFGSLGARVPYCTLTARTGPHQLTIRPQRTCSQCGAWETHFSLAAMTVSS